ncbi:branched-chain amino acid transport system permease protein [Palleronia marisminoris]|uniref:High-affinity branched-chain amino acid transport system permease protein LivH n=1 Tax=Palleronia marisminoris TaxID=315423 RepID=A0A1Y5RB62_9RHOB|nr:branched-chain amino acid ABC transporter permease [Palleronia marisminoris]SFG10319.1 branched-chain amino acid transport system permease protein [Palleronia marisminoris]SLN13245.1 High-affinity branched-chain amino acid transport system permease protein LivH [Palleronia marisminoris]
MSKWLQLAILAALIAALPLLFPSGYYYRIGALVFVNALAVIGLAILIGQAGQISLGHAGFAGIGAYSCALGPEWLGLHPALSLLAGAALSGVTALLIGRPILRLRGYYLAVATLGFGILVAMVIQNERALTGGPDGMAVAELGLRDLLRDLGWRIGGGEFWYAVSGIVLILGAWIALNIFDSPTGRAMRALHGSEVAARTVGIDVASYKLKAFVISAVYASVSGSLLALQNRYITPDVAGFLHSIELVTMTVLGGAGSIMGAVFGAAILTILPQVLTALADYEQLVLGAIMIVVMIFMPQGLLPYISRRLRRTGK